MKKLYLRNRLCIPVKGYNRSVIYDLLRNDYYFISNYLFDVIESNDVIDLNLIEDISIRSEAEKFLISEEIIFEISVIKEKLLFPSLITKFKTPFIINEIIIHENLSVIAVDKLKYFDIRKISIVINHFNKNHLRFIIERITSLEVDSIYLYLTEENLVYLYSTFLEFNDIPQLHNIYLFKSNCNIDIEANKLKLINVIEITHSFKDYANNLYPDKFTINYDHFFESFNKHSYFNAKVYINEDGKIKNGISSKILYADLNLINETKFINLINSKNFQRLWGVRKKNTIVCMDCEFKYMCVDNRLPLKSLNDKWHHEIECNYNPYISKWKNEEGYKSLSESGINIEKEKGIIKIDEEKLSSTFKSIWN